MSGRKLFFKRFVQELLYQWNVIQAVLDWSIILYIVIPTIILIPFLYVDVWQNIQIYWSDQVPFSILVLIVLLLSVTGNFRTYLLEADVIFLLQQKSLLYQLKLFGFLSSCIQLIAGTTFIFALILPILIQVYQFSGMHVVVLFFAICAFRFLFLTLKKIINRSFVKWLVFLFAFLGSILSILQFDSAVIGGGGLLVVVVMFIFHLLQLTKTSRWFLKEIEIEVMERVKYIRLILNFSMEIEKEPYKLKKRPIYFFPKSKRIFKIRNEENGLLELLIKAFVRNRSFVKSYFQLLIITISAIIVLPIWLKWVIFISCIFFINSWLSSIFKKMMNNHFFDVAPFNKDMSYQVWARFKKWVAYPVIIATGVLTCSFTFLDFFK